MTSWKGKFAFTQRSANPTAFSCIIMHKILFLLPKKSLTFKYFFPLRLFTLPFESVHFPYQFSCSHWPILRSVKSKNHISFHLTHKAETENPHSFLQKLSQLLLLLCQYCSCWPPWHQVWMPLLSVAPPSSPVPSPNTLSSVCMQYSSTSLCTWLYLCTSLYTQLYLCTSVTPDCTSLSTTFLSQAGSCIMRRLGKTWTWTQRRAVSGGNQYLSRATRTKEQEGNPKSMGTAALQWAIYKGVPILTSPAPTKELRRQWQNGGRSNKDLSFSL